MRDDLVEQHRGVRFVQRRDLTDGAGVAIGAVEHAVHFGAGRRRTGQTGQRGGDHRAQCQAQLAAQRGDHAAHPRRQRRRRPDLRQQHIHTFAGRRHLRIGAKSARAQRDHVDRHRGAFAAETDQRRTAVGGDAELAGDRADVGRVLAEPEQVLHQHRVRRRRGRQPRHDSCRQHRPAAQHLLDVVGQRRRSLLQPDGAREAGRASRIGRREGGCRRRAAAAGPAPVVRRRGRRHRWPAARRRCPTGRSTPGARAGLRGRG